MSLRELRLCARFLDRLGLGGKAAQFLNLLAHLIGAAGKRDRLEHRLQPFALAFLHLLQLVRIGQIRRRLAGEILRAFQTLFQPPGAVLKRTAHGVGARREPALVERHQEADRAGARVLVLGRGAGALALHEARHVAVEIELGAVDLEIDRVRNALGEDRFGGPRAVRPPLGEVDHRLLGAAQVERCAPAVHRLPDRFHVGVGVGVEELQEQAEVRRIAFVGGRSEQQDVIGAVAKQLAEPVAQALVRLVGGRHAVRLVHDDEVPMDLPQPGKDFGPLRQIERRDHPIAFQPLVHAELVADVLALHHQELRVELLFQFALPLEGEVGRADDQDALGETPKLQLANEKARHDRLAGTGVVGQQEPHARELEQVVVDRLELMRQRIDARDREAEIRIELVGDAEGVCLKAEAEQSAVAVERMLRIEHREAQQVVGAHRDLAESLGIRAHEAHNPTCRAVGLHGLNPHRLVEERAGEDLAHDQWRPLIRHAVPLRGISVLVLALPEVKFSQPAAECQRPGRASMRRRVLLERRVLPMPARCREAI